MQELEKRGFSKAGLKAELRKRLKKALVDKNPAVDTAKILAGSNDFDKESRWKILDPTIVAARS